MWNPVVILQSIVSGILMGGIFALFGVGFSLTWGVMKVINIAHAAFGILAAYAAYWGLTVFGIDPILSLAVSLPLLFGAGLLIHRFLVQPITRSRDVVVASMVLTFGLAIVLENLMLLAWSPDERLITTGYSSTSIFLGDIIIRISNLLAFVLSMVGIGVIYLFLYRTRTGKAVRATWQDPEGAALQGINLRRVSMITFGMAIASAGAGGVAMAYMYSFNPPAHNLWLIFLFLVVIVGGVGSILGSAVAGLIIGVIIGLSGAFFPMQWINVLLFGLLMGILLIKPEGLFRK
ncbi:MAG: branched-chain amino acid ABC transporter permease [Deltaproteobacteria bacterium HGW-Deltaproteobacteria-21]|nr:MAG: branched-chain amino acid ABC transporter permease [Deltaproteobacteria bacterium HGW-Deltaproteobacteria-21]